MKCFHCKADIDGSHFVSVEVYDKQYRVQRPFCGLGCLTIYLDSRNRTVKNAEARMLDVANF